MQMFTCPKGELWCREEVPAIHPEVAVPIGPADVCTDETALVSPAWRRGELALKKGEIEEALESDEDLLQQLGQKIPRHPVSLLVWLTWEIVVQLAHCMLRPLLVGRRNPDDAKQELIAARHLGRLSHVYARSNTVLHALWAHLRELNLTEKYAPTLEGARAYAEHALVMSWLGRFERGCAYAEDSVETFRALGSLVGHAHAVYVHAVVLHAAVRFSESIDESRIAVQMCANAADPRGVNLARCQLAASYLRLGRLPEAIEEAKAVVQSTRDIADVDVASDALAIWARASDGDIPAKATRAELDRCRDDPPSKAQLLIAEGIRLLYVGQLESAVAAFEEGCDIAKDSVLTRTSLISCRVWHATALREVVEKHLDVGSEDGRLLLKRARRMASLGRRMARSFQADLPHALRECASVAALCGRKHRALRLFEESLAVADRQHACYEYALSLEARGRLGKQLGWSEAGDDVADGRYVANRLRSIRGSPIADNGDSASTIPSDHWP